MSASGPAILLVASLAGLAIVTPLLLCFVCHALLHILGESSGGSDVVRWPNEIVTDWWWKPIYCLGLLGFWGVTSALLLAPCFLGKEELYYVIYPISLLSSLAAHNPFMVLYPPLLGWLVVHPRAFLTVCVVTLPLPAAAAALVWAMVYDGLVWALPAALVCPAALLFYARAWGRLAWLALNEPQTRRKESAPLPASSPALDVADPWQVPEPEIPEVELEEVLDDDLVVPDEEIEDEWSRHKKPYGLVDEEQARRDWQNRRRVEQPIEPGYDVTGAEAPPPPVESEKYRQLHKRARRGRDHNVDRRPPTFRRAFGVKLFAFLFYGPTLRAWINLSSLTLLELALLYLITRLHIA
jgi:hypothetical protein